MVSPANRQPSQPPQPLKPPCRSHDCVQSDTYTCLSPSPPFPPLHPSSQYTPSPTLPVFQREAWHFSNTGEHGVVQNGYSRMPPLTEAMHSIGTHKGHTSKDTCTPMQLSHQPHSSNTPHTCAHDTWGAQHSQGTLGSKESWWTDEVSNTCKWVQPQNGCCNPGDT